MNHTETAPIKVVYLDHTADLSGGEIALLRLLEALGPRVDPHVVLATDGPFTRALTGAGIRTTVLPLDPDTRSIRRTQVGAGLPLRAVTSTGSYVRRIARLLRIERPDVVHTNSLKAALYGGVASRLAGRPVIWHIRDRIAPDYLAQPAVQLVRALSRVVPAVTVANSKATLATVPNARGGTVVPNALPVPDPLPPRQPYDGPLRVGVLGRLAPWKGQHVFLEAFARAFGAGGAVARLVGSAMFGEQDYEQQLRRRVAALGLTDRVEFRGFRDDVWAELAELDLLVHSSVTPEPFGQVVVEGLAAGLPVIAAAAGGPAETITDGVDGLLVRPNDPAALAAALRRLADDVSLRAKLATAAPAKAGHWAPDVAAAQMLAVYRSLVRRG